MKYKSFCILLCLVFLVFGCSKKKTFDYRIGVDPSWYTVEAPGMDKNLLAFSTELLQEIAHIKKKTITLIPKSWDNLTLGLAEKEYEGVLSSLYPYIFYTKKYSFSDPYLMTGVVLVVAEKSKIDSLEMLKGKEVGVLRGSTAVTLVDKYPDVMAKNYDAVPTIFNDLLTQNVDAVLVDNLLAQAYIRDLYHGQLKIVTAPLTDQGLRLITIYDQAPGLIKDFNKGLKELKENGRYDELLKKWGFAPYTKPQK